MDSRATRPRSRFRGSRRGSRARLANRYAGKAGGILMKMDFRFLLAVIALVASACAGRVAQPSGEIEPVETPRGLGIDDISVQSVNTEPEERSLDSSIGPVVTRTQILLNRARFSVGIIDGKASRNTALALSWFQRSQNLPATSVLDSATQNRLVAAAGPTPPVIQITVDAEMLKGPILTLPK